MNIMQLDAARSVIIAWLILDIFAILEEWQLFTNQIARVTLTPGKVASCAYNPIASVSEPSDIIS